MTQVDTSRRVNVVDKRIFGGTTDCNQLVPFAYPWAWQAYLQANTHHWLPGHFRLASDQPMTDIHQLQVLELYLGWRLAISTALLEVLPALYRNTTAPECRQYILRHMQEESVAIEAISECSYLDLPNMGLWVVSQAKRIEESMPHSLEMTDAAFAVLLSAVVVYKSYVNVALETWLLKESQLPTELRKMISALQRDGVAQRNFYTQMLQSFLVENPRMTELVKASTIETATADTMTAFTLHWFNRDLIEVVGGPAVQFAQHCWSSTVRQLGFVFPATPSPYDKKAAVAEQKQQSNATLTWD